MAKRLSINAQAVRLRERILHRFGRRLTLEDSSALVRCERALHRWSEGLCGTVTAAAEIVIEFADPEAETGPQRVIRPHDQRAPTVRVPVPDVGKSALVTASRIAALYGLVAYWQRDPRGAALYLCAEPAGAGTYTDGVPCCA